MATKNRSGSSKAWYPATFKKATAIPLITGNVRVDGFVMTPVEARKVGVDIEIIAKATELKERIREQEAKMEKAYKAVAEYAQTLTAK